MDSPRRRNAQAVLVSLEADAKSARGGFACLFSNSDEYESALISERRAQGHYNHPRGRWPILIFVGCSLLLAGSVLLLN
ncbi:MAG: hypothetical protein KGK16_18485 [Bradyrhizobium sp.]|nr:hypothetical protein [Bradyrhizobium sp.]